MDAPARPRRDGQHPCRRPAWHPYDFADGDLEQLASELENDLGEVGVGVHVRDELGYGGPLLEVLAIWEAATSNLEHVVVIAVVGNFLRTRWRREKDACGPDEKPRPRAANGYDEAGTPLWSIRIDLPDGMIEEIEDQVPAPRPAPPDLLGPEPGADQKD